MDAPREVWIVEGNQFMFDSDPRIAHDSGKPVHRYVRADLAPSTQPAADSAWQPAESSAQVRRLAEALVSMCQKYEPKTEEELAAFVQAKRFLASPEAPAACWCRAGAQEPCDGFVFGRGDECRACGRCEKCHGVRR